MSFTNINDPAGVKALLEQLRASQAWQQVSQSNPAAAATSATSAPALPDHTEEHTTAVPQGLAENGTLSPPETTPSSVVANLLSQLRADSAIANPVAPPPAASQIPSTYPTFPPPPVYDRHLPREYPSARPAHEEARDARPVAPAPAPFPARKVDLRSMSFQQALPVLALLPENPDFVEAISSMKEEQAELEQQLWDERRMITRKYEEKVSATRTKAKIVGVGLTQHEADSMSAQLRGELERFDATRAMPAWDGLLAKQQAALEALGVPTMYATTSAAEREKQQRVVQVLAGIVGGDR